MSLDYVLIGRRIHDIRKLLHMTQSELAEAVDLTEPYISRIETGVRSGSLDAYVRIAAALGVTVDHLLYGNQPHDRPEYQPELYKLMQDCSSYERRIIYELAVATKGSLRNNRSLLIRSKPHHN